MHSRVKERRVGPRFQSAPVMAAGDLGFDQKLGTALLVVGTVRLDLLERHLAMQFGVFRNVNFAQSPFGVRPQDAEVRAAGTGDADGLRAPGLRLAPRHFGEDFQVVEPVPISDRRDRWYNFQRRVTSAPAAEGARPAAGTYRLDLRETEGKVELPTSVKKIRRLFPDSSVGRAADC